MLCVLKCAKCVWMYYRKERLNIKTKREVREVIFMLSMLMKKKPIDLKGVSWAIGSINGKILGVWLCMYINVVKRAQYI